jgi:branched-chain amino acid transport system ATP-binding protein
VCALLEVKSLSKRFKALQALSDVSFDVNEGEILGVIGPNGAGKTTLFNLLSAVYQPTSGKIIFNGQEIQGEKPHEVARKGIGRTYQVCQPFKDLSVMDNVLMAYGINHYKSLKCFGKYSHREHQKNAMSYLEMVGLENFAQLEAKNLSLVNQRRMEIARALALHPKIILMDESAAGLTHEESLDLIGLIFKLKAKAMSVVLIEHNMRVAMKVSERLVVLNYGHLISQGSPETVQNDQRVIDAYLGNEG